MNIDAKLKYLTENHYEILEYKFDIFIFQVLKEDPNVTDILFTIDANENISFVQKRSNSMLSKITNIRLPSIDNSFYKTTGFPKDKFKDITDLASSGNSPFIDGLCLRSQLMNPHVACRIGYMNLNKNFHLTNDIKDFFPDKSLNLTKSAEDYVEKLFDTYHLSCQLERNLKKSAVNDKKLKV